MQSMSSPRSQRRTSAARVAAVYLAVGVSWILLSDRALAVLVHDPATLSTLQTLKGWFFVSMSALFIGWLVGKELRKAARTQSQFEALAGQGIVGTFAIQRGRLVHANARLAELFGYAAEELEGMRVLELVAPNDRQSMRARGGDGQGPVVRRRFTGKRKDGSILQAEVHGRITDWDGQPAMAGILLDISDHVRLHDRLRQAGRLEALGEVTGAVAHDFNNFLTGILGNLDLVLTDIEEDPAAAEESLLLVRDAASRAANLTGQLLSFSRGRSFQHRPIDVNEHLLKLVGFLRSLTSGGQTVSLELTEDVPPILLDPVALDQLLVNLFVNAKQAIALDGHIVIRTRSRVSSAGADVFIEVQDNGMGMPTDILDRIFEPFFTTKERGTGLGLATVRSIMDEARGHLTVDSTPGAGTTVRLIFPEAAHVLITERTGPIEPPDLEAPRSGRILILDEDAAVGRVMATALRRCGYSTMEAGTADDLSIHGDLVDAPLDLVILDGDINPQRRDALVEQVRRLHPDRPILLTTGTNSPFETAAPRTAVLAKPFSVDELLSAVDAAFGDGGEAGPEGRLKVADR